MFIELYFSEITLLNGRSPNAYLFSFMLFLLKTTVGDQVLRHGAQEVHMPDAWLQVRD